MSKIFRIFVFEMTPYDLAYDYAMYTNECIFLTGKAGTGKTTFLRRLQRECPKQIMVCAPTGVAAINAEGVTIHSLFQLPPQVFCPTESTYDVLMREMRLTDRKLRILRNLELLVIDEVSMVRADLLDAMDAVLRRVRHRSQPFGGVQMLFIGDLYQLSPVARDTEWNLMREYYSGPYFFQAQIFTRIRPIYIELDKVYRQANQDFVDILNQVRTNSLSPSGYEALNARYVPNYRDDKSILLSTHNRKVDAINARELENLTSPEFSFDAKVDKDFPESMYPMDTHLVLKKGARVMFIKNDSQPEKAYYNGKLGTIVEIDKDKILVQSEGENSPIEVHREVWKYLRYVVDKEHNDEIRTEIAGTFTHYPLRLSWAVTIHKAQGLTFDRVIIDAEDAFAAGQVYVALSRCRTLEGITLLSKIPSSALTNARDVLSFTEAQPSLEETENSLSRSELSYFMLLLCTLYDFSTARHQLERLRKTVGDGACFNQPATDDFIRTILNEVMDWQKVAESFQHQIRGILSQPKPDFDFLVQRLKDAYGYFEPRIRALLTSMEASPAITDNKDVARDYRTRIEEAYVDLARQNHVMAGMRTKPSIRQYFALRKNFIQPAIKISATLEEKRLTTEDSQHPELLARLRILRAKLSKEADVRAYQYAPTSALVQISNELPVTRQQLLRIKGFGPKMYGLWGETILEEVRREVARHYKLTDEDLDFVRSKFK